MRAPTSSMMTCGAHLGPVLPSLASCTFCQACPAAVDASKSVSATAAADPFRGSSCDRLLGLLECIVRDAEAMVSICGQRMLGDQLFDSCIGRRLETEGSSMWCLVLHPALQDCAAAVNTGSAKQLAVPAPSGHPGQPSAARVAAYSRCVSVSKGSSGQNSRARSVADCCRTCTAVCHKGLF